MPVCIKKSSEEEILKLLQQIEPSFGAINLEDIESPKSLRVVREAAKLLQIPVFHDDQQGTAVVAFAALTNSLKLAGKAKDVKIVLLGADQRASASPSSCTSPASRTCTCLTARARYIGAGRTG